MKESLICSSRHASPRCPGLLAALSLVFSGVETAGVWCEESQSTCARSSNFNRLVKFLKRMITKVVRVAIYLARACPKCKHYLDVVIPRVSAGETARAISAVCVCCRYQLDWKLLPGRLLQRGDRQSVRQRLQRAAYLHGSERASLRIKQRRTLLLIKPRVSD